MLVEPVQIWFLIIKIMLLLKATSGSSLEKVFDFFFEGTSENWWISILLSIVLNNSSNSFEISQYSWLQNL